MKPSNSFGYYYDKDGNTQYFIGLEGLYAEIEKVMGKGIVEELKSFHDKCEDADEEFLEEYLRDEC